MPAGPPALTAIADSRQAREKTPRASTQRLHEPMLFVQAPLFMPCHAAPCPVAPLLRLMTRLERTNARHGRLVRRRPIIEFVEIGLERRA